MGEISFNEYYYTTMLDNNAPPLRGMLSGIRDTPGPIQSAIANSSFAQKSRMWSSARNGLMTHGSAPTTEAMLAGAAASGVRSAVTQVGRSNGTISKATGAISNAQGAKKIYDYAKGKMGGEAAGEAAGEGLSVAGELAGAGEAAAAAGEGVAAAGGIAAGIAEVAPLLLAL